MAKRERERVSNRTKRRDAASEVQSSMEGRETLQTLLKLSQHPRSLARSLALLTFASGERRARSVGGSERPNSLLRSKNWRFWKKPFPTYMPTYMLNFRRSSY